MRTTTVLVRKLHHTSPANAFACHSLGGFDHQSVEARLLTRQLSNNYLNHEVNLATHLV